MAGQNRLQADPLFQGLARPVMVFGVSFLYFILTGLFCMIIFINTKNFLIIFVVGPILFFVGRILCAKEPRAIELAMLRGKHGYKSSNNLGGYHFGANSYDTY
jgi:type IV secretory pathway VirB3-like protein